MSVEQFEKKNIKISKEIPNRLSKDRKCYLV